MRQSDQSKFGWALWRFIPRPGRFPLYVPRPPSQYPGKIMMKSIFGKTISTGRGINWHLSSLPIKILALVFFLSFSNVSQPKAQAAYFWSEQARIPEYMDSTEEPPYLIADMNHVVHAFNSQPLNLDEDGSPTAVFYRQWTIENGWTSPNDILFDPDGYNLNLLGVAYDSSGRIHLIIQKNGDIFYTQNYLANANVAVSWPTPAYVAGNSAGFGPGFEIIGAIATNRDGNEITVIFSGRQNGNGLYFTSSSDGGNTWTVPYPIYLTGDESMIVTDPKLYVGESGLAHAAWATFLETGFGGPGYYANFDAQTKTWSEPMELDVPGIRTPAVIETQGNVFVSYYHSNVNGHWWRRSGDNGETWSLPEQVSSRHVGTNGALSFSLDGENVLHAFFGERINDQNHGIWHVTYTGATWTNPEAVVRGAQRRDKSGGNGFDPRSARSVIVNGNLALVAWGTDGFGGTNGAWFSYKRLTAPELPAVVLEAPTLIPASTPTVVVAPTVGDLAVTESVDANGFDFQAEPPAFAQNPQTSIFIGVIPTLLLLIGTILIYFFFQHRIK